MNDIYLIEGSILKVKPDVTTERLWEFSKEFEAESFSNDRKFQDITTLDFSECTGIKELQLKGTGNLSKLSTVILPPELEKIGREAFKDCMLLENIELPDSLKVISEDCFYGCKSLEHLELKEGLLRIENSVFSKTGLRNIIVPSTVEFFDSQLLYGFDFIDLSRCHKIKEIKNFNCEVNTLYLPCNLEIYDASEKISNIKDVFAPPSLRVFKNKIMNGNLWLYSSKLESMQTFKCNYVCVPAKYEKYYEKLKEIAQTPTRVFAYEVVQNYFWD